MQMGPKELEVLYEELRNKIIILEGDFLDHDHSGPSFDQTKQVKRVRYILFRCLGPTTSATVTGTVGGDLEMPFSGEILKVGAYVDTAGITGSMTVDIHKNGTTIMAATKISIETTEKSSRNAATQPVVTTKLVSTGDILTVDIDAIQTTAALGLTVFFVIKEL